MSEDRATRPTNDTPDPEKVERRADGRPPEEASSDDARAQAEVILTESDERVAERSAASEPDEPDEPA